MSATRPPLLAISCLVLLMVHAAAASELGRRPGPPAPDAITPQDSVVRVVTAPPPRAEPVAARAPAPGPCVDQCDLEYSTCLYQAMAARNSCMIRCSMGIDPRHCGPACMRMWRDLTRQCDTAHRACLATCP